MIGSIRIPNHRLDIDLSGAPEEKVHLDFQPEQSVIERYASRHTDRGS
jgi:hypothetical protein